MNCPDCDVLMFKDECGCGFKVPRVSTLEIKQVGAQETHFPVQLDPETKRVLEEVQQNGIPYPGFWKDYGLKRLRGNHVR